MSWCSSQHEQVRRDMEDSMKVDKLINFIRDDLKRRYARRASKLGLDQYSLTVLAASAAGVGLFKAIRTMANWNPDLSEFSYYATLKARRIAVADLVAIEREKKDTEHVSLDQEGQTEIAAPHCDLNSLIQRDDVKYLMAALKPEHSQVLSLDLYGYSNAEIARRLGRSEESTKSLLRRAREAAERISARQIEITKRARDGPPSPPTNIIFLEDHRKRRGA